jgi:hypothetical protein
VSDLGAFYASGLLVAGGILIAVFVLGGLVLWLAARAVRTAGEEGPPPTRFTQSVSTGLAVAAGAAAAAPAIAAVTAATLVGPEAVMSGTELVAVIALGLGILSIGAARILRHPEARAAVGVLLVVVIVIPAVIQVWATAQIVDAAVRYRTNAEQVQRRAVRYADLADGPSVGELVAAVGTVGSWRAVTGYAHPYLRYDEWIGDQGPVADLAGRTVHVSILAQCWVEGDPGELYATVTDYDGGLDQTARFGRCDGTMQVLVMGSIELPLWSTDRVAAARRHDRYLLGVLVQPVAAGRDGLPGENAIRFVVFVSPDPATPADDLTEAVTAAAGSFEIR